VNPLKRLKLKSQLRNCDYVLAGTVIKQQYYDPAKNTVINGLIDEFMANPNFENALKLIEYNEMLTFYFTESCAGGLYVRKSTQDPVAAPARQSSPDDDDDFAVPAHAGSGTVPKGPGAKRPDVSIDPDDPAETGLPQPSVEPFTDSKAEPVNPVGADGLSDPLDEDPKRRFRRQKQQEILQESEALMEQLLSLDIRRRKPAPPKDDAAVAESREPLRNDEPVAPKSEPDDSVDADTRLYKTPLHDDAPSSRESDPDISLPPFAGTSAAEAAPAMEPDAEPDMAPERPASSPAFSGPERKDNAARRGRGGLAKPEPVGPKPSWARKPYWEDDVPAKNEEAEIPARGRNAAARSAEPAAALSNRGTNPAGITAEPAAEPAPRRDENGVPAKNDGQPATAAAEPTPHRLPKRSYANVIATLKIDIHTMAKQLEDCRRQLSQNPPNEKQLIAWISALEDAIEEFSQVVDHLEEHQ
jgi:hypothetical protein